MPDNNDADNCLIKISWQTPTEEDSITSASASMARVWPSSATVYQVKVWDYIGGAPRTYNIRHPMQCVYTYARWGAKLHVEVNALNTSQVVTKIISRDLQIIGKPAEATESLNYPALDFGLGVTQFFPTLASVALTYDYPPGDPEDWEYGVLITGAFWAKGVEPFKIFPDDPALGSFDAVLQVNKQYSQTVNFFAEDVQIFTETRNFFLTPTGVVEYE